jgi:Cu(I)/Ag(I) efflux system protein CusF
MKRNFLFAALLSIPLFAFAQGQAHKGVGVVKSVDPKKPGVTLAHDPIPSLRWPAMTMGFSVKDKALLAKLKPGAKVEFEMVQQGSTYIITSVK